MNKRLADAQGDTLRACGIDRIETVPDPASLPRSGFPYLVISDDLYISRTLLREFLAGAATTCRLALKDSLVVRESRPLQTLVDGPGWTAYPAWVVHGPDVDLEDLEAAPPQVIDPREDVRRVEDVPKVFAPDGVMKFAVTARVAIRLEHWVHVLRANQLAMLAAMGELKERPWWRNALAIASVAIRSFPPNEARVMRALVRRGRGVKIHPSAVVEASVLGDGARVGANAVVRGSVLGAGAVVAEGAFVEMSVIGEKAHVTKHVICSFNVLHPGAVIGLGIHQMSVVGRDAFIAGDVRMLDFKFDGEITVEHRGKIASVGSRFLGCAVGHGAMIGAGVTVQHGRAIPNGARLIGDPGRIARKFAASEPGDVLVIRDGVAMPLARREAT